MTWTEFAPPTYCGDATCRLVVDVVNSNRVVVETLYDAELEDAVTPFTWETSGYPVDVDVMRAWLNHERIDSWVVLLEDGF